MQIVRNGHQVDVSGSLAVPEQGSLDAVGPRGQGQLRSRHRHALIVVRVERDHHGVAVGVVSAEVFDHIGIVVWRASFDGGRQVQDERLLCGGPAPGVVDGLAYLQRKVQVGIGELFGRELEADVGFGHVLGQLARLGHAANGHLTRLGAAQPEYLLHV